MRLRPAQLLSIKAHRFKALIRVASKCKRRSTARLPAKIGKALLIKLRQFFTDAHQFLQLSLR